MAIEPNSTSVNESREIIGSGFFDVNKTRSFMMDENSTIYLDKDIIDNEMFEIIGSGFKSTFTVNTDVDTNVESGTINSLELTTNLKGPITSLNPLMLLEQPVLETSDTIKAYSGQINLNQNLTVSGYLSSNNSLKATRIMSNDNDWKVRGFASQVNGLFFNIGTLQINRNSEDILDCNKGFVNGSLVEVKMAVDLNYQAGKAIDTIQSIRCLTRNRLADEIIELPSVLQGFISQIQGQDFWLDDVKVNVDNNTQYINGELDFIDDAVNVEVQGTFDTATSEIVADVVRFIDHRVEITFPVEPNDISSSSVTILGMTYYKTPQTKDNAGIFSPGINQSFQLQIQGYLDSEGQAYISKTLDKGTPDLTNVSIRGGVTSLNNPTLSVNNVEIDATDSTIINLGNGVIDVDTFFDIINVGLQVEIKNANYNDITNQLTDGTIKIRASMPTDSVVTREIIGSGFFGAYVTATISSTDGIFQSSFE